MKIAAEQGRLLRRAPNSGGRGSSWRPSDLSSGSLHHSGGGNV